MRSRKISEKEMETLIDIIFKQKTKSKLREILEILLTERELNDLARRSKVWEMLGKGDTYLAIQDELKMASSTICRLSNKFGHCELQLRKVGNTEKMSKTVKTKKPNKRRIRYKKAPDIVEILFNS